MSHLLLCLICFHETLPSKNSLHLLVKCILKMENVFGSGGLMVQVAKIFAIQYFLFRTLDAVFWITFFLEIIIKVSDMLVLAIKVI